MLVEEGELKKRLLNQTGNPELFIYIENELKNYVNELAKGHHEIEQPHTLLIPNLVERTTSIALILSWVNEAKKDIFDGLKIRKLHFKNDSPEWDYPDEDIPKLLDKLEKWFGE